MYRWSGGSFWSCSYKSTMPIVDNRGEYCGHCSTKESDSASPCHLYPAETFSSFFSRIFSCRTFLFRNGWCFSLSVDPRVAIVVRARHWRFNHDQPLTQATTATWRQGDSPLSTFAAVAPSIPNASRHQLRSSIASQVGFSSGQGGCEWRPLKMTTTLGLRGSFDVYTIFWTGHAWWTILGETETPLRKWVCSVQFLKGQHK